ncbi:MAG: cytochrome c3 family protein [Oligoflexia bacterium]|nr:cytochrome c3 family protein [Oligoflexia bacterium]
MRTTWRLEFLAGGALLLAATAGAAPSSHPPFASKKCKSCHVLAPDKTPIPDQFIAEQPDLCYNCHDRVDENPIVHKAVKNGDCTDCHMGHESPNRALLQDKIKPLCSQCHKAHSGKQPFGHSALDMRNSCVHCHFPHSSEKKKLMKDKPAALCVTCHTDFSRKIDEPGMNIHSAMESGCQSCHNAHGAKNDKLLIQGLNDLCFKCHEQEDYTDHPRAGHPIGGRPDPVHPERPMSCISCHKPHYSKNANLFRYNFRQGETPYDGTICSVCHWQTILPPPGPPKPNWND